jgi:uncharacterized protein involved in exopolysaccharide biosynthesis
MLELLTIIYRWKWHIGILTALAILASILFSGPKFMPPYFESFSVFYPSNPAATDRATLFGEDAGNRQINYFGTKSDVNRMLTIANSGGLMNHLIQKFDLVQHYKVDTTNKKFMFYVAREFKGNYEAIKTDRDAIEISILDQDPVMASDMVNAAVSYVNDVNNSIVRDNKSRTLDILNQEIESKEREVAGVNQQLRNDRKNGVLQQRLADLLEEVGDLKQLADQYKVSANEGFASIYIIESAAPALVKAKPVRWMIVVLTAIGAFIFAVLLAIFLEKFKTVKANA